MVSCDFCFFVHLMLNSEKCPKNDPKMHKELQVDDKNMMFGMFATNNHTKKLHMVSFDFLICAYFMFNYFKNTRKIISEMHRQPPNHK